MEIEPFAVEKSQTQTGVSRKRANTQGLQRPHRRNRIPPSQGSEVRNVFHAVHWLPAQLGNLTCRHGCLGQ